nr:arginine--tRNA ligase, chloroplastic/mitochondrial [Tanacetum cinerariifolium]
MLMRLLLYPTQLGILKVMEKSNFEIRRLRLHIQVLSLPISVDESKVKQNQEKDKIGSKPDKNEKRDDAGKSLKQLQWIKEEKPKKTQKEWSKTHTRELLKWARAAAKTADPDVDNTYLTGWAHSTSNNTAPDRLLKWPHSTARIAAPGERKRWSLKEEVTKPFEIAMKRVQREIKQNALKLSYPGDSYPDLTQEHRIYIYKGEPGLYQCQNPLCIWAKLINFLASSQLDEGPKYVGEKILGKFPEYDMIEERPFMKPTMSTLRLNNLSFMLTAHTPNLKINKGTFQTMTIQDLAWNMDAGVSSHLADNTEMDLLSFIRTVDPTKVRISERERDEDEPKLLETTVGRVVPLLPVDPDRSFRELEASKDKLFDEGGSDEQADQGDSASGGHGVGVQLINVIVEAVVEDEA